MDESVGREPLSDGVGTGVGRGVASGAFRVREVCVRGVVARVTGGME